MSTTRPDTISDSDSLSVSETTWPRPGLLSAASDATSSKIQ